MSDEAPEEESPRPTRAAGRARRKAPADETDDEVSNDDASKDGEEARDEESERAEASEEASARDVEEAAPRPRKKKAKPLPARRARRPAKVEDDADEAPPAPLRDDVPAFAQRFPDVPELTALVAAFERGEYARVREEAPRLAKATDNPEVRAAARELRRRLDPDPIAVYLLIAAAVLLAFLAAWFWTHPHELPAP